MRYIITKIYRNTKDKNNNPLKTKDGRPYERVAIQVDSDEHGGKYISGFGNARNKNWQVGEEININVVQNGQYLNFEMPTETQEFREEIMNLFFQLEKRLVMLEMNMEIKRTAQREAQLVEEIENSQEEGEIEPDPDKIPF